MSEQDKLNNMLRQSNWAVRELYIFVNFVAAWSLKHPNVKIIRIQDSWSLEGDLEECQLFLDEVEKFMKKGREYESRS